jgi:mannose-6-phosphate isomerase-like protein (cupin superfamily)
VFENYPETADSFGTRQVRAKGAAMATAAATDLFDTLIHLRPGGVAEVAEPRTRLKALAGRADAGLWTVGAVHADSDRAVHADVWERHPSGDEVLCVLAGAMQVYLRDHADGAVPVATLTSGQSFIVPVGQWHRLAVVEPADLLAITPRVDTQHEKMSQAPGGLS